MNPLRKLLGDKRGNALMIVGAAMPMLIGAAGLATDTIQWALWKRQLQRAADSAALAGVYARAASQAVPTAVTYDLSRNNQTGYPLLAPAVIGTPPDADRYTMAVSVELKMQHALSFSSFFMSSPPIITANATAAAVPAGDYCARALINTNATGIRAGGSTTVNLKCGMITNSTSLDAAVAFGASSVTASPVAAVGGLDTTDNWAAGTTLLPFTIAADDPFGDINPPAIPASCNDAFGDKPGDNQTWPAEPPPGGVVCVKSWESKGTVNLQPDTTYIITGDMGVNSGAVVNCARCTFVMTNSIPSQTGTVDINGGAKMNLSSPESGTYKGILFYSNRGADSTDINKINGNSASVFQGAFYFPHQVLEFTGNAGVTFECIKLVTWSLSFMGNSNLNNNCATDLYGDRFMGRHVRLVA